MKDQNNKPPYTLIALAMLILLTVQGTVYAQQTDLRNIRTGTLIPDESYSDQPYLIKTDDHAWLCVLTTAKGAEVVSGQHIIAQRSYDQGKTWVDKVDIEPANGPEASYAVLLKAPGGRIFVFYNHNSDNIRQVKGDSLSYPGGVVKRVDSQGYFVFKYSDDNGKSWSAKRYTIPVRLFDIDRRNPYQGKIRFFWNVGKPFTDKGAVYVPLIKVGGFGEGFYTSSEGVLLRSPNLLNTRDAARITWSTLPDGDIGLKAPEGTGGPISEEQSYAVLSDGSYFCVYRTIDGWAAYSYSRDGGHHWEPAQYMRYADGRLMKHPRAANFVWKCENGKYLYWYHNQGGDAIKSSPKRRTMAYNDRNPVWISGGLEQDSPNGKVISWSQPEILLYDPDPMVRISYPDLLEEGGDYFITETQKDIARVHKINPDLLNRLWDQPLNRQQTTAALIRNWAIKDNGQIKQLPPVILPELYKRDPDAIDQAGQSTGKGFTIELAFSANHLIPGEVLLDARDSSRVGWVIRVNEQQTLEIVMNDGQTQASWSCDHNLLKLNQLHYVSIIVDGGPKLITYVVDGMVNDGGKDRQFGWGRFSPYLKSANSNSGIRIGPGFQGQITYCALYSSALTNSQAIGNYRACMQNLLNHK